MISLLLSSHVLSEAEVSRQKERRKKRSNIKFLLSASLKLLNLGVGFTKALLKHPRYALLNEDEGGIMEYKFFNKDMDEIAV